MIPLRNPALVLCLLLSGGLARGQDAAPDVKKIADRALKSVVVITFTGRDGREQGLGSGFVISKDG